MEAIVGFIVLLLIGVAICEAYKSGKRKGSRKGYGVGFGRGKRQRGPSGCLVIIIMVAFLSLGTAMAMAIAR